MESIKDIRLNDDVILLFQFKEHIEVSVSIALNIGKHTPRYKSVIFLVYICIISCFLICETPVHTHIRNK